MAVRWIPPPIVSQAQIETSLEVFAGALAAPAKGGSRFLSRISLDART